MSNQAATLLSLFRLAQLADGTLPVGAFSFSLGLEAAVGEGIVSNAEELEEFARGALYVAAESDCVILTEAFRAESCGDFTRVEALDHHLLTLKAGDEVRAMTLRMGNRLATLLHSIAPSPRTAEYLLHLESGTAVGSYPVVQALAGVRLGIDEESLYAAHLYGVANTVVSSALRLMSITHFETQRILFRLGPLCERLYTLYADLSLDSLTSFAPLHELAASLHERGQRRLFMN